MPDVMTRRLTTLDWDGIEASLDAQGFARIPSILSAEECGSVAGLYNDDSRFRSRVDMERFRFGVGEYKYFAAPLPPLVRDLREAAYPRLAPIANAWAKALGARRRFPKTPRGRQAVCRKAGQTKPTPPLLAS